MFYQTIMITYFQVSTKIGFGQILAESVRKINYLTQFEAEHFMPKFREFNGPFD